MEKRLIKLAPYENNFEYLEDLCILSAFYFYNYISDNANIYQSKDTEALGKSEYSETLQFLIHKLKSHGVDPKDYTLEEFRMIIDNKVKHSYLFKPIKKSFKNEDRHLYSYENFLDETSCMLENITLKLNSCHLEIWFILVSLLNFFDTEFFKVFRLISGKPDGIYPTIDICTKVFKSDVGGNILNSYDDIYDCINNISILFPSINPEENFFDQPLICDERLVDIITGQNHYSCDNVFEVSENTKLPVLMFRDSEMEFLTNLMDYEKYPIVLVSGSNGIGKKHLISHFCQKIKSTILFFDMSSYLAKDDVLQNVVIPLKYALRECALKTISLGIVGFEKLKVDEQDKLIRILNGYMSNLIPRIFLISEQEDFRYGEEQTCVIELSQFDELQRIDFWHFYTQGYRLSNDFLLERIANTFIITPGKIIKAVKQASLAVGGCKNEICEKDMYKACYHQINHKLAEKATKANWGFVWNDLKLHKTEKSILRDICNCIKYKHTVLSKWNFSKIVPYGAGLTVIFSGPPGTGKTMAAQVIATELNMELYKIDLSQIVDKYIGETEKNIKEIFTQAKKSNSILFFDEADAIFSKRLEATGANERFANIESSLLLQCIEEYSGITIIATNNYAAIDPAFIRRFKYHVKFREPDNDMRYEIWKSVLPKEAPIAKSVDIKVIADMFDFTGAIIKNVILAAAFLAADHGGEIRLIDILRAIKRELEKDNIMLTKAKLGNLGYLFDEINKI